MLRTGERAENECQVRRTQLARSPCGLDLLGQADTRTLVLGNLIWVTHRIPHYFFCRLSRSLHCIQPLHDSIADGFGLVFLEIMDPLPNLEHFKLGEALLKPFDAFCTVDDSSWMSPEQ